MGWGLPGGKLCCDSLMWNNHTGIKASRLPPRKPQRDREGLNQRFLSYANIPILQGDLFRRTDVQNQVVGVLVEIKILPG